MDLPVEGTSDVRHPVAGPRRTLPTTPPLPPGGARRTTSIDVTLPEGFEADPVVVLRGQDLVGSAGGAQVVDAASARIRIERIGGTVLAVDHDEGLAPDVVGLPVRRGWAKAVGPLLPDERTVLASLLEDLGGVFLISGYASLRAGLLHGRPEDGPARAAFQADVCIGWARGGDVVTMLERTGTNAVPMGPTASPDLLAEGWHAVGPPAPYTVRRLRRLDVAPASPGWQVQAHLRDTYAGDEADRTEMVMHEYVVDVAVDEDRRVAAVEVDVRVLPWDTCPGAVASAPRIVGESVADLPALARAELKGPTTCTHLSSTLRSLADVGVLVDRLEGG